MPINVAYEPDPRLLASAAYRVGLGGAYGRERQYGDQREQEAYQRWLQDQQDSERRRQALVDEQMRSAQFTANRQDEAYRQYESARNFYEPSFSDIATLQDRQASRDDAWAHWNAQLDWQQQQDLNRQISFRQHEEATNHGKWIYSAQQQQRQSQLLQEIDALRNDDSIDPAQREDAMNQRYSEYQQIIASPEKFEPNQTQPDPAQIVQSQTHTDPVTGHTFIINPDGKGNYKLEVVKEPTPKQPPFNQKLFDKAMTDAETELTSTHIPFIKEGHTPTRAEILSRANELYQGYLGVSRPEGGPPVAGTQPQQPPDQPGIAQTDQGAAANQAARKATPEIEQLMAQFRQARDSGNDALALQIKAQIKQLQLQP